MDVPPSAKADGSARVVPILCCIFTDVFTQKEASAGPKKCFNRSGGSILVKVDMVATANNLLDASGDRLRKHGIDWLPTG